MKKLKLDLKSIEGKVEISDGYHTFDELYDHRITLYIALCKMYQQHWQQVVETTSDNFCPTIWRSQLHSDGINYDGWFILGIGIEKGHQITYHIPNERWEETNFAQELKKAPEFDGHKSQDVLERIKKL